MKLIVILSVLFSYSLQQTCNAPDTSTCDVCLLYPNCYYCAGGGLCGTASFCSGLGTPINGSCGQYSICSAALTPSNCQMPSSGLVPASSLTKCNATNSTPPPTSPAGTFTGVCATAFSMDYPACSQALRDYACTSSCGYCNATYTPQGALLPCTIMCTNIMNSCTNTLNAGCISINSYTCSATNCEPKLAATPSPTFAATSQIPTGQTLTSQTGQTVTSLTGQTITSLTGQTTYGAASSIYPSAFLIAFAIGFKYLF